MNRYDIILKKPTNIQSFVDKLVQESKIESDKNILKTLGKLDLEGIIQTKDKV